MWNRGKTSNNTKNKIYYLQPKKLRYIFITSSAAFSSDIAPQSTFCVSIFVLFAFITFFPPQIATQANRPLLIQASTQQSAPVRQCISRRYLLSQSRTLRTQLVPTPTLDTFEMRATQKKGKALLCSAVGEAFFSRSLTRPESMIGSASVPRFYRKYSLKVVYLRFDKYDE